MTSNRPRAAIFDFGGVMTEPLFRDYSSVPEELMGLVAYFLNDFHDVYGLPTGAHDLHLLETGRISEAEFFDRLCARYAAEGNPAIDPRVAEKAVWGHEMVACAAMEDAVRQLRHAGIPTALLTNISRNAGHLWRTLAKPDELFDVVVDSSAVGLRKPDPAIYHLTCERLGAAPADCLFVDDLQCNVDAAAALGMTIIHCHDPVACADEVVRIVLGHAAVDEGAEATAS